MIELDLDLDPRARYATLGEDVLRDIQTLLTAVTDDIPGSARNIADLVRLRTGNRFHAEIVAMAGRAGVDWRDIMLANISYDLALSFFGCTTIALPTSEGPVLARNMDWWPEKLLARCSYEIRYLSDSDIRFTIFGWPGSIGVVTGMSSNGFAIALNAVIGEEGVNKTGYPVLLHLRRVLEDAADYGEALKMLTDTKLAAPALLTIVGSDNDERAVVERSPTKHAIRRPVGNDPLVATNDYRMLFKTETHDHAEIYMTSCVRFEALDRSFKEHSASQSIEDSQLLYILTGSPIIQRITAQHIIMRPSSGESGLFVPRRLVEDNGYEGA